MSKLARTITCLLPAYQRDRYAWRRKILGCVLQAAREAGVAYRRDGRDTFEVVVLLYLTKGKRHDVHDVDNLLKDILDALQGRFGGPKSRRSKYRLIANDHQVCRVLIEKQPIPKALDEKAGGRLLIRPYRPHRWPLQPIKGARVVKRQKWRKKTEQ